MDWGTFMACLEYHLKKPFSSLHDKRDPADRIIRRLGPLRNQSLRLRHDIIFGLIHLVPDDDDNVVRLQEAWENVLPFITGEQLLDLARRMIETNAPLGPRSLEPLGWRILLETCADNLQLFHYTRDQHSGSLEHETDGILGAAWMNHTQWVAGQLADLQTADTQAEAVIERLEQLDVSDDKQEEPETGLSPCVACQSSLPTHMPFTCQHLVLCKGEDHDRLAHSPQFAHIR